MTKQITIFQQFIFFFAEAYAQYKIWIKAYTVKNEGKSSEPLVQMTDVRAPGQPIVVNLTCQNGNTLFLKVRKSQKIFSYLTKGQIKPKADLLAVDSPKKQTNKNFFLPLKSKKAKKNKFIRSVFLAFQISKAKKPNLFVRFSG